MITDQKLYTGVADSFTESFADYPASLFNLAVYLKQGITDAYQLTTAKDGDSFVLSYAANLLKSGDNQYQYVFTEISSGDISIPYAGYIHIDLILGNGDQRTDDKIILDSLIDARKRLASREYVQITINGRATTFKDADKLDAEIVRYKKKLGIYKTPRLVNGF